MIDWQAYGAFLKQLRVKNKLSQEIAAEKAFLTRHTIINIEKGKTIPSIDTLMTLSEIYRVDLLVILSEYKMYTSSTLKHIVFCMEKKLSDFEVEFLQKDFQELESYMVKQGLLDTKSQLLQYYLYVKAFLTTDDASKKAESLDTLYRALQVFNPSFDIDDFDKHRYSQFELRILATISNLLYTKGYESLYKKIIQFCYENLSYTDHTYFVVINHYCAYLTRSERYEESIEVLQKAIDEANDRQEYTALPLLHYLNCINYIKLGNAEEYKKSLHLVTSICDLTQRDHLKQVLTNKLACYDHISM